eukprot:CFRG7386T1
MHTKDKSISRFLDNTSPDIFGRIDYLTMMATRGYDSKPSQQTINYFNSGNFSLPLSRGIPDVSSQTCTLKDICGVPMDQQLDKSMDKGSLFAGQSDRSSIELIDDMKDLLSDPNFEGLDFDNIDMKNLLVNGPSTTEPSEPNNPNLEAHVQNLNNDYRVSGTDSVASTMKQLSRSRLISESSDGSTSRPASVNSTSLHRNTKRKTSESCEDDDIKEETRKEQKLEKNRQSARECRKRKKEYIKGLELMMKKYAAVNESLQAKLRQSNEDNSLLRQELNNLKSMYEPKSSAKMNAKAVS